MSFVFIFNPPLLVIFIIILLHDTFRIIISQFIYLSIYLFLFRDALTLGFTSLH